MRSSSPPRLPPETKTLQIMVECGCGQRNVNLRMVVEAVALLRQVAIPPDQPVQSWWCRHCKFTVPITARQLHLAL